MCDDKLKSLAAYEWVKREDLPDIHAEGILLRHKKSGARIVLIPCRDNNKVFNIAFRTPPSDSTGVAHIIEHTVLCGSRKFPLKDPFVELVKGSLNTFLNAITYPDKTMFPVASTNDADFRNLMDVYLDAVFYPNIYREEKIFKQEGWSYRIEKPEDPITYNGVVYNEMKGVYSSAEEFLEREIMNQLFPDTPYGVESGGDPEVIPTLTYEQFLAFHRKYYHPSNSYIYLYGDMDMADTLEFLDREYLSAFDKIEVSSRIPRQKPFEKARRYESWYPVTDEEPLEENTYLSCNCVTGNPFDMKELIAFDVLDYALLSQPGAPVKQAILDAGIGKDVYGEFDDGILQPYFSITAKNARAEDADRFVQVVLDALRKQAEKGIDRKSLYAGLHYLEFQFREADYSTYPKGLMYGIDVMDSWLYDDNQPFVALRQLDAYEELKKEVETGYFENLLRTKLLGNPHSVLVVLKPKRGLARQREKATAEKLAAYKASLTPGEIDELIRETKELIDYQNAPEDPENIKKLPVLRRSDIRKEAPRLSNEEVILNPERSGSASGKGIRTIYHTADTNGIGYLDLLWSLRKVPEDLLPYVSLYKTVLMSVSTEHYCYMDLNNEINGTTGGMSSGISLYEDAHDPDHYEAYFTIRCKALYGEIRHALEIIREVALTSDFADEKRIYEVLNEKKSQMEISMQQSGHTVASSRAKAYFSPAGAFAEKIDGIGFQRFLRELAAHYGEKKGEIAEKLSETGSYLFSPENLTVSYTSEKEGRAAFEKNIGLLAFDCMPPERKQAPDVPPVRPLGNLREGFTTAGQVQFVAMTGNFLRAGQPYRGTMQILRTILSYGYLWQQIRVLGGAYGCGAVMRRNGDGVLSSYRDPHFARTVEVFRKLPAYLRDFRADEAEMTKYIIGTMSSLDTPMTPSLYGSFCIRNYLTGVTQEELQRARDEILSATDADIRALADAWEGIVKENCLCVVGSTGVIEKHADLLGKVETLL